MVTTAAAFQALEAILGKNTTTNRINSYNPRKILITLLIIAGILFWAMCWWLFPRILSGLFLLRLLTIGQEDRGKKQKCENIWGEREDRNNKLSCAVISPYKFQVFYKLKVDNKWQRSYEADRARNETLWWWSKTSFNGSKTTTRKQSLMHTCWSFCCSSLRASGLEWNAQKYQLASYVYFYHTVIEKLEQIS